MEIRLAADPARLPLLRTVAEAVALSSGLTLDEASDVRLAVDEAACLLIPLAAPDATLSTRFVSDDSGLRVRLDVVAAEPAGVDDTGFSWEILQQLTDSLVTGPGPRRDGEPGFPVFVEFSRSLHRGFEPEPEVEYG